MCAVIINSLSLHNRQMQIHGEAQFYLSSGNALNINGVVADSGSTAFCAGGPMLWDVRKLGNYMIMVIQKLDV